MGLCEYWYMIEYSMVGIEHINPRTPSRAPAHAGARGRTRAHAGARGLTRAHADARRGTPAGHITTFTKEGH